MIPEEDTRFERKNCGLNTSRLLLRKRAFCIPGEMDEPTRRRRETIPYLIVLINMFKLYHTNRPRLLSPRPWKRLRISPPMKPPPALT
jgi:hypothetical protein